MTVHALFPGAAPVHPAPQCAVRGRKPHPATDGQLCRTHLDELGTWLHDIETEARRLVFDPKDPDGWTAAPSAAIRYDGGGGSGNLASHRTPAILDPIVFADPRSTAHGHRHVGPVCKDCPTLAGRRCSCPPAPTRRRQVHWSTCPRHGIHPSCLNILADRDEHDAHAERLLSVVGVLHGLAQRVRDEHLLGPIVAHALVPVPAGHEGRYVVDRHGVIGVDTLVSAEPTVASERQLLTRWLDWIAAQPWVIEARRELADLRQQLLRANRNTDDEPLPGWCYQLVDGEECKGDLWPADPAYSAGYETDAAADGPYRPGAVVCGANPGHRWETGADRARLTVIVDQQLREDAAS